MECKHTFKEWPDNWHEPSIRNPPKSKPMWGVETCCMCGLVRKPIYKNGEFVEFKFEYPDHGK